MPCGEVPVLLNFHFCTMVTLDMPCDKVSVLLISWFTERAITDSIFFCFAGSACLQNFACNCDVTSDIIAVIIPPPACMFYNINSYTSDGVKPVPCPGKWKMLKYGNRSMAMEVWKRKYGSEEKAVYRGLVPYWVTTVPIAKGPGGFSSHFHTSISVLRFLQFSIFRLSSHAQFTCSYQSLGMRLLRMYWIAL